MKIKKSYDKKYSPFGKKSLGFFFAEKILDGCVIDAQGKRLQVMGNKLCQVGDKIWTDGKVIFGHTPLRSTPLVLPNIESGIPVVADEIKSGENKYTCGYFTKAGVFKKKQIAEDTWTTNAKKLYKHGKSKEVIDAEIAFDLEEKEVGLYTATATNDGVYFSLGDEEFFSNVTIKKNDLIVESFDLKNLLDEKNKFDKVNSDTGITENVSANAFDKIAEIFSDSEVTPPLNLSAQIVSFKINRHGETEMIVGSHAAGNVNPMKLYSHGKYSKSEFQDETFLWESTDTVLTQDPHLKNALILFWEHCVGGEILNFEVSSWKYDGEIDTDTTLADVETEYLTHFKNGEIVELIEEKFKYPKIKNNSVFTIEYDDENCEVFFGFQFDPPNTWRHDENGYISSYNDPAYVMINDEPVPAGILNTLAVAWTAFFIGGEVDGEKIVVTSPTDINPYVYLVQQCDYVKNHEIPNPIMTYRKFDFGNAFVEDSRFVYYRFFAYENHDLNIKNIFNRSEVHYFILEDSNGKEHKVWLLRDDSAEKNFTAILDEKISEENISDFYFPIQDGYYSEWAIDTNFSPPIFNLLGIYDSFSKIYYNLPTYEKYIPKGGWFENLPNLSLAKLNKGHLLGFHNENLYKIYGNNFEKVGEGLKNFRLREMKNLKGAAK